MEQTNRRLTPEFWASLWEESRSSSILRRTQDASPERWRRFYDAVAGDWDAMAGDRGGTARAVTELLNAPRGPLRRGASALEVGSGPGSLSLAIAERGLRVTALDDSEGMQEKLARRARRKGIRGIRQARLSWRDYRPRGRHDLVVASSFPAAWSPDGIARLESLSRGFCCLTLGVGGDPFPFRRLLWRKLMKDPPASRSPTLPFLFNWLLSTGRRPDLVHRVLPVRLDMSLPRAVRFYSSYFAIFGLEGPAVERRIGRTLAAHAADGRLGARGDSVLAVLVWPAVRATSR